MAAAGQGQGPARHRYRHAAFGILLDIWGRDIVEGGIAYDTGDPDGLCVAVPHSITRMGWAKGNAAQAMLTMREADGSIFYLDPRGVLARVLDRYTPPPV